MKKDLGLIPTEIIENKIYLIRGIKVMLDSDLASLYGVETSNLNKSVKRNLERFPEDFMFQLTLEESKNLRFQIGISSSKHGGNRYAPYAFTEQGVAMLASSLEEQASSTDEYCYSQSFYKTPRDAIRPQRYHY